MGANDSAELCELVGLFLLHHLSLMLSNEAVGLYQDDGLTIMRNSFGPEADITRKQVEKIFEQCSLKVIVDINVVVRSELELELAVETPHINLKCAHANRC